MNKEYLHKVLNHIVSETIMDYDEEEAYPPFAPFSSSFLLLLSSFLSIPFLEHCEEVYGLTEPEIEYIWEEYKQIIRDKIENQKG